MEEACLTLKNVGSAMAQISSCHTPLLNVSDKSHLHARRCTSVMPAWAAASKQRHHAIGGEKGLGAAASVLHRRNLQPSRYVASLGPHSVAW